MARLADALRDKYIDRTQAKHQQKSTNSKNHHCRIFTPKNIETVQLCFREDNKVAKIVGNLAKNEPFSGKIVKGLVIEKDFNYQIISSEELEELTNLIQSTLIKG
jgi:cleavage and polyadenylation specificity factor subunit 3